MSGNEGLEIVLRQRITVEELALAVTEGFTLAEIHEFILLIMKYVDEGVPQE